MEAAASQVLRALRAHRSQVAFSRLLGYRSNVAADWENGRRFPTIHETLRAADRVKIDVSASLRRFYTQVDPPPEPTDPEALATWLKAVGGHVQITELAERGGFSRFQVSRWLSARARPRLPDFLTLLEALTGRAADWVAALVDIEEVPALEPVYRRMRAAGRLAFDVPWASAVLTLLETGVQEGIAQRLAVDEAVVEEALTGLMDAGIIRRWGDGYRVVGAMTIDVGASSDDVARFKAHWMGVAAERARRFPEHSKVSVNLFAVSQADLGRLEQLQQDFYRELRSLVATSEPSETVALAAFYLGAFD